MPSVHGLPLYHEIHGATNGRVPAGAVARRWGHDLDFLRSCAAGARARPAGDRLRATGLRAHSKHRRPAVQFVDSADDAAALLKHCIGHADLFGSATAGRFACRSPSGIRELCANWEWHQASFSGMAAAIAGSGKGSLTPGRRTCRRSCGRLISRSRRAWRTCRAFRQVRPTHAQLEDIPADSICGITAPTLVMLGDGDVMRPNMPWRWFRLLPNAQLAVLPGTDHIGPMRRTDWVRPWSANF
jgi:hypothetical protein